MIKLEQIPIRTVPRTVTSVTSLLHEYYEERPLRGGIGNCPNEVNEVAWKPTSRQPLCLEPNMSSGPCFGSNQRLVQGRGEAFHRQSSDSRGLQRESETEQEGSYEGTVGTLVRTQLPSQVLQELDWEEGDFLGGFKVTLITGGCSP